MNFTSANEVELIGEINASLCSQVNDEEYIPYKFIVKGIHYFNMVELDISYTNVLKDVEVNSSLTEVTGSDLLTTIKEVRGLNLRHLIICTYDEIFEIACKEFEMKFNTSD